MNMQSVLDQIHARTVEAPAALEQRANAVKGQARKAAEDLSDRYEDARDTVEKGAEEAKFVTVNNLFRAYDVASRLLPMILPERAARVRSRRMTYAAVGGVLLGAGAMAILEMRRPGTLSGFFKKAKNAASRGLDDVEKRAEDGKERLEQRLDATKDHVVDGARAATERVASAIDGQVASIPLRVDAAAKDAKTELQGVKEKVLHTLDSMESEKRAPRVVDGIHRP